MNTLERFSVNDLTKAQRLVALSEQISAMSDPSQIADARAKVETVKAYAKAKGLADAVSETASRLSVQCALKIGECGPGYEQYLTPRSHADHVKYLLKHRTYSELMELVAKCDGAVSLQKLRLIVRDEVNEENERNTAHNIAAGNPSPRHDYDFESWRASDRYNEVIEPEDLTADEAREFVADNSTAIKTLISAENGAFKVSDIAGKYIDALRVLAEAGEDPKNVVDALADPNIFEGIAEMVRLELRTARYPENKWYNGVQAPEYVTYYDDDAKEWLRIPWDHATLSQLKSMAKFRRKQAEQLSEQATELEDLAATIQGRYESRGPGHFMGEENPEDPRMDRFKYDRCGNRRLPEYERGFSSQSMTL